MEKSNYIRLIENRAFLIGLIKLQIAPSVIEKLEEADVGDINSIFCELSMQRSIFVSSSERNYGTEYYMHTRYGVFTFVEKTNSVMPDPSGIMKNDDSDGFKIIGFREATLLDTNRALINGIVFSASEGIVFLVMSKKLEMFVSYFNGEIYDSNVYKDRDCQHTTQMIQQHCAQKRDAKHSESDDEEELTPSLEALLDKADNYSFLSNELEREKADKEGKVSYKKFEAVMYPKIDRIAYQFSISKQDKRVLVKGTIVDVLDKTGETGFSAEVIDVHTTKQNELLTLLFTKEVDINAIPPQGWLRLSVSNVNMEVQTAAIKNVRLGRARAKYFNNVLGKNMPQGFEEEDLSELEETLKSRKYPPNESQVYAIKNGILSKDIYLVMGPPGTGKTTVIAEWVNYFVNKKHWRVLVSSQNNKAVDNVLERFVKESGIETIRIGSESKVDESLHPLLFENKIKSLRESISDSTNDSINCLGEAIKKWEKYRDLLRTYKSRLDALMSIHKAAKEYVHNYIHSLKRVMYQSKKMSTDLIEKINSEKIATARYIRFVGSYNQKNTFLRCLLLIPKLCANHRLSKSNGWLVEWTSQQNLAAREYNQYRQQLELNYQYFDDKILPQYYSLYKEVIDDAEQIVSGPPEDCADYELFLVRALTESEIFDSAKVSDYMEKITKDYIRAMVLLEDISAWKEDISSAQNYALNQILLDAVDLVGATCIGVSSQKRFQDLDFDVAIIDEAGQIQIHNVIVPMSVANKVIMLGDHMQIPPMADMYLVNLCEQNDVETDLLGMSLFEKMYNDLPKSNKTILDTQYRMPAEIADVLSGWFYNGRYKSFVKKRNMEPTLPSISEKNMVLVDVHPQDEMSMEKPSEDGGYSNPTEAKIIKQIVDHILKCSDYSKENIGVISAYKAQVQLIRKELMDLDDAASVDGIVASLDSYQGQEREIIIYSFTRSSKRRAEARRIGFLSELRRLNVAMSRCKKLLIMVGDYEYLSTCEKSDANHIIRSEDGMQIINGGEATFSEFIRVMVDSVKNGNGEMIDMTSFLSRIGGV